MDKVSIIVPLYKAAQHVAQLQQQISVQTYPQVEWVLVDDCSPDETWLRVQELQANLPQHHIIIDHNERNLTAGPTRNRGLELSSGDFVFFMDADDMLAPHMIERLLGVIEEQQSDFVCFGHHCIHPDKSQSTVKLVPKLLQLREEMDKLRPWCLVFMEGTPWTKLVRRKFLDQHHIEFPPVYSGQDQCWTVQLVLHARKIAFVDEPLYTNVEYATSLSRSGKSAFYLFEMLEYDFQYLQDSGLSDAALYTALQCVFYASFMHRWQYLPEESKPLFASMGREFFAQQKWPLKMPPMRLSERFPLYKLVPRALSLRDDLKLLYKKSQNQRRVLAILQQFVDDIPPAVGSV